MARPRVFVSSTYYDLKHIRASLSNFIESLGFECILSEKGDIVYSPDISLDEACYREVDNADIFVLIIGGRYGSPATADKRQKPHDFYERFNSITKGEYEVAAARGVPIYVLIESNVYVEYETFRRNASNQNVAYAHVDSANIFELINEILRKPRNNPVHPFAKFSHIKRWLRAQWAGRFRDLLNQKSNQEQLATLSDQVTRLDAINETLQRYLEEVVKKVLPDQAEQLIHREQERRSYAEQLTMLHRALRRGPHSFDWLREHTKLNLTDAQYRDLIAHSQGAFKEVTIRGGKRGLMLTRRYATGSDAAN